MSGIIKWTKKTLTTLNPGSGHLHVGIDIADNRLYTRDDSDVVKKFVELDMSESPSDNYVLLYDTVAGKYLQSANPVYTIRPYLVDANIDLGISTTDDIVITGENFDPGTTFSFSPSGSITLNTTTIDSPTQATLNVTTTSEEVYTITAANGLSSSWGTLTLTVEDVDYIVDNLTTSLTAYNAATALDWVAVTKTEYDDIVSAMSNVSRMGTSEANWKTGTRANFGASSMYTFGKTTEPSPVNSYIFGFKIACGDAVAGSNDKVKLTASTTASGLVQYGSTLPASTAVDVEHHFIMKSASNLYAAAQYLAISTDENSDIYHSAVGGAGRWGAGDISSPASISYNWCIQGLTTTIKQWN